MKTAIVTGASRGIGSAIARRLARDGFTVVVNYMGGSAGAKEVVGQIESAGDGAAPSRRTSRTSRASRRCSAGRGTPTAPSTSS